VTTPSENSATSERIVRWLRCPASHERLAVSDGEISCPKSDFHGSIRDNVAVMLPEGMGSFFDDKFEVMTRGKDDPGAWDLCYAKQIKVLAQSLRSGMLVLDVGCGPLLPYAKPEGVAVVGLDLSFNSIRANQQLDLRVFGTAYSIPFADRSVDGIVCFYAVHHMVGNCVAATFSNVARAFAEFARVLKPGGVLCVFEMLPNAAFRCAQALCWNRVKRVLGTSLDMFFFSRGQLGEIAARTLPQGATLERTKFDIRPFRSVAPVFNLPKLTVPRFAYPLGSWLYKWQMPAA
jgi:ubiquinone/menaquinone biosynthesis C-methylase UbiE